MPTKSKLNNSLIRQVMKLGNFRTRSEAINVALTEFLARSGRLRILELEGQIDFDPDWNPKSMRRRG